MNDNEYPNPEYLNENMWASILAEEENEEDNSSTIKLSSKNYIEIDNDWEFIKFTKDNNKIIQCEVIGYNNRGLLVKHKKFKGFIPLTHLEDSSIIEKEKNQISFIQMYLNKMISVRILEFDTKRNRIVLSERIAKIDNEKRKYLINKVEIGSDLIGKITNIKDFGLFIDLGGLEGLVHISEISWERVNNIQNIFKIGQKIKVKIFDIDANTGKISLSIKRLIINPWERLVKKYPNGKNFIAKVIGIAKYGVFVKLEEGLEGLIHISEIKLMDGDKLFDVIAIGEEVLVELISVDINRQRMSLRLVD